MTREEVDALSTDEKFEKLRGLLSLSEAQEFLAIKLSMGKSSAVSIFQSKLITD